MAQQKLLVFRDPVRPTPTQHQPTIFSVHSPLFCSNRTVFLAPNLLLSKVAHQTVDR
ncbi:hypothetical protein LguiA_026083 [Lonicera macranthoides]